MRSIKFRFVGLLALVSAAFAAPPQEPGNTYDYIIVGSGPGGGTLAANLAKAGISVLLLEAGDDRGDLINQQIGLLGLIFAANDPLQRWDYFVKYHTDEKINEKARFLTWRTSDGEFYVGNKPPAGSEKLGIYYPRAGVLGGCATHNAMAAAVPNDSDWDYVADITGDESWRAKNMRKHLISLETANYVPKGTKGHGFSGFLDIHVTSPQQVAEEPETAAVLQTAANLMGQKDNVTDLVARDLNNPLPNGNQTGLFGFPVHMAPGGIRRTSQHAIYEVQASSKAKFLNLQTQSFVTKVLFETPKGKGKKPIAVGVSYLKGQSIFKADPRWSGNSTKPEARTAYARYGVILAAGVFNTPQILKHSGVGPAAELRKHKIPIVVDLPGVGENLQDNYEISVNAASTANFTDLGAAPCTFTGGEEDPCYHLWKEGKGPYTNGIIDALMYKTSKAAYGERDLFMWGQTGAFRGFYPVPNLDLPADPQSRTFGFSMAKIHSRSRGSVLIKGTDPTDVPDINFRFFEGKYGDADLAAMAEGIEFGRKVFKNTPAPVGPFTELDPCNVNAGESPNCNVKEFIRAQAWSHHATSSAAIGSDKDKLAVLDSKFRVRGVENLRVVDGSAFPRNPGGFPVLPTFMLGEKASEVIIKEHRKK